MKRRASISVTAALFVYGLVTNVGHTDLIINLDFEQGFNDSSGNDLHSMPVGDSSIVFDSERNSNVLSLDGDDDVLTLDSQQLIDKGFDLLEDVSVSMWVNTSQETIGINWTGGLNTDWVDGAIHFKINYGLVNIGINGGGASVEGTTVFPMGEWHHIVFTASMTDWFIAVYYDGVEEAYQIPTDLPLFFGLAQNPVIGGWNNAGDIQREWLGFKDDVRIYNHALTPEEVTALFVDTQIGDGPGADVGDWSLY